MPVGSFYDNLSLAEKVRKFAEHHSDPLVRHISQDEASFLRSAAAAADRTGTPGRVGRVVGVGLVLAGACVVYRKRQAKVPQRVAGLRGYVGQEVIVTTTGGPDGEPTHEIRGVLDSVTKRGVVLRDEQGQEEFLPMPAIHGVKDSDGRTISEGW